MSTNLCIHVHPVCTYLLCPEAVRVGSGDEELQNHDIALLLPSPSLDPPLDGASSTQNLTHQQVSLTWTRSHNTRTSRRGRGGKETRDGHHDSSSHRQERAGRPPLLHHHIRLHTDCIHLSEASGPANLETTLGLCRLFHPRGMGMWLLLSAHAPRAAADHGSQLITVALAVSCALGKSCNRSKTIRKYSEANSAPSRGFLWWIRLASTGRHCGIW